MSIPAVAARGAGAIATAFKALFTTKAGIAITAGTAGLVVGSNTMASAAMNSPAMMQMSMMRGMPMGMPMGYPGVG